MRSSVRREAGEASRLLPAHVMVRYVIALRLFFGQAYEEFMRQMTGALQSLGSRGPGLEGAQHLCDE
jgi:Insertion element 4 transposase N-terminal